MTARQSPSPSLSLPLNSDLFLTPIFFPLDPDLVSFLHQLYYTHIPHIQLYHINITHLARFSLLSNPPLPSNSHLLSNPILFKNAVQIFAYSWRSFEFSSWCWLQQSLPQKQRLPGPLLRVFPGPLYLGPSWYLWETRLHLNSFQDINQWPGDLLLGFVQMSTKCPPAPIWK